MKTKKLKHYKQTRYKAHRKPINKTLLLVILAGLIMIGGSIALGAYLGTLSSEPPGMPEDTAGSEAVFPYDEYPKLSTHSLCASMLPSSAYESDEAADAAILRANGSLVKALCINLTDESGKPTYDSAVYEKAFSAVGGNIDLALFLEKTGKNGISVTAAFSILSLNEQYADIADIRRGYEIGLICEAYAMGLRDVVLTDIDAASPDELYSLVREIKAQAPELAVGISVTPETLLSDSIYTAKLDDVFDYIAFNFTEAFGASASASDTGADTGADTGTDTGAADTSGGDGSADTDGATGEASDPFTESVRSALVLMGRFSSRAYIEAGDGCEHCVRLAEDALLSLGVQSYMLALSEARH